MGLDIDDQVRSKGEEISMFDVGEGNESPRLMNETELSSILNENQTKLIYVYDFLSMWTFYVELAEIVEEAEGTDYPNLMYVHGQIPDAAPEKNFEAENLNDLDGFDDDLMGDYDDLDFDENWN